MTINPSTPFLLGIDVSNHQKEVDWAKARQGRVVFACAKATEGNYYRDPYFPGNWSGMKAQGIIRGAYHYFVPSIDAAEQARYFLSYVNAHGGVEEGDFLMLDLEDMDGQTAGTVVNRAAEWVTAVKQRVHATVFLYTGPLFWKEKLHDAMNPTLAACPLWAASYTDYVPVAPRNWPHGWTVWQSSDGKVGWEPQAVDGVPTCDIDRYYGDLASLETLVGRKHHWSSLGGRIGGGLSVINNQDGRLEVFSQGTDGQLYHIYQTAPNGGWVQAWERLDGQITGHNVALRNADGRVAVFARGADAALLQIVQLAPNGGWSSWSSLGSQIQDLFAGAQNADGRLEIVAQSDDSGLWRIAQTAAGGDWGDWSFLDASVEGALAVAANADGRLEVFARDSDGAVQHIAQQAPGDDWSTSQWASLGGRIGHLLAVGRNADGRLEVFAAGVDRTLLHTWQREAGGSWNDGWVSLGGAIDDVLSVASNQDGRLAVFTRGQDHALWHIHQQEPGGRWGSWVSLGGEIDGLLAAGVNADRRLEVFARSPKEDLRHIWQTSPGGSWIR